MTSEFRELVCVPIASSDSRITTSRPASASARATARPTTPAPITTASTFSKGETPLEEERRGAGQRGGGRHRPRGAVERSGEQRAQGRTGGKPDRADERGRGAGGLRERRERRRGRVRHDQRGTEQE